MTVRKKQKPIEKKVSATDELRARAWSVISFEKCEAKNLTYAEAEQKLGELAAQDVPGLCIVTNQAAARIVG